MIKIKISIEHNEAVYGTTYTMTNCAMALLAANGDLASEVSSRMVDMQDLVFESWQEACITD